jgi:DNA-binding GntR family transcriptional regulator
MVALYDLPGINTCSVHEHLEILQAIEAGQHQEAERLMEDHLLSCERQLRLGEERQVVDLAQALGAPPAALAQANPPIAAKPRRKRLGAKA